MKQFFKSGTLVLALVAAALLLAAPQAHSAVPRITQSELFVSASNDYSANKDIKAAVWDSLDQVKETEGSTIEIMAGLAEVLMLAGLDAGIEGEILARDVACSAYTWADRNKLSTADTARLLSQAILGVRTIAQQRDLNMELLLPQLQRDVAACAGDQGPVMARVVGSSFEEETVRTYTPVGYSFLADAAKIYRARKAIDSAVDGAFAGAEGEGLKPLTIASGLSETLMLTGLDVGDNGADLAGQILCAVVRWLNDQGRFGAGKARITMEALSGIRMVATREGFDNPLLQNRIENAIAACSGDALPVVQTQFDGPVAQVIPPEGVHPPIPPGTPPDVEDDFDPPASES